MKALGKTTNPKEKEKKPKDILHGAFKGGRSAGYHNTVGSLQGFAPKSFHSSRNQRQNNSFIQKTSDFMDQEDIEEFGVMGVKVPGGQVTGQIPGGQVDKVLKVQDLLSFTFLNVDFILNSWFLISDSNLNSSLLNSNHVLKPNPTHYTSKSVLCHEPPRPVALFLAPIPPPTFKPLPTFLNPLYQTLIEDRLARQKDFISCFISLKKKSRLDSFIAQSTSVQSPKEVMDAPLPIFTVPTKVAQAALKGFMPFGSDIPKQDRYKTFLRNIVHQSTLDQPSLDTLVDAHESREFSKAAMIYRPMSDMISSRFTNETGIQEEKKVVAPVHVIRTQSTWRPSKLLCKRLAVAYIDDGEGEVDKAVLAESKQALNPSTMQRLILERDRLLSNGEITADQSELEPTRIGDEEQGKNENEGNKSVLELLKETSEEEAEKEEGKQDGRMEKPSMDLFKAIFDDSDDDDESDQDGGKIGLAKNEEMKNEKSDKQDEDGLAMNESMTKSSPTKDELECKKNDIVDQQQKFEIDQDDGEQTQSTQFIQSTERKEDIKPEVFRPVYGSSAQKGHSNSSKKSSNLGSRKRKVTAKVVVYDESDDDGQQVKRGKRMVAEDFM